MRTDCECFHTGEETLSGEKPGQGREGGGEEERREGRQGWEGRGGRRDFEEPEKKLPRKGISQFTRKWEDEGVERNIVRGEHGVAALPDISLYWELLHYLKIRCTERSWILLFNGLGLNWKTKLICFNDRVHVRKKNKLLKKGNVIIACHTNQICTKS